MPKPKDIKRIESDIRAMIVNAEKHFRKSQRNKNYSNMATWEAYIEGLKDALGIVVKDSQ